MHWGEGLSALIATTPVDLSGVRAWTEFATCLHEFHRRSGHSLTDLERAGRRLTQQNGQLRELKRSTVSDVLNGKRKLNKPLLLSLLAAWGVPEPEQSAWLAAWQRTLDADQRPANARRFEEATARELGVHAAINTPDTDGELPSYVSRDFDDKLRRAIAARAGEGAFVVLVGGSSTGKTRSLYEAVHETIPDYWLIQPPETRAIVDLLDAPPDKTVLWLDELDRFLGTNPPLTKECVRALVRAGTVVVGTLWPDQFTSRRAPRQVGRADPHADDRKLLEFATVISVAPALTPDERQRAAVVAEDDSRIRIALDTKDAGLTQVLAAGPDLVHWWEQAPDPYARAVITTAADARRLGVHTPLNLAVLTEAMFDYLPPPQRVTSPSSWLETAIPYATTPLHGAVAALSPVDGGVAGTLAGYVVADYLAQHVRRTRRTECPPHSAWQALIAHIDDPEDLRRLSASAMNRFRYQYAEQILHRLAKLGDGGAAIELAHLLVRQDRLDEAIAVLRRRLTIHPIDTAAAVQLARTHDLLVRAAELRSNDPVARQRLAELLADRGEADGLRTRADSGDHVAADHLAELLADRGCLGELRERADGGHRFAADLLADLLAALGQVDALGERAAAGDEAASLRLAKLPAADRGERAGDSVHTQMAELRQAADSGNEQAASQLTALLFELGNEVGLRQEVDAGTHQAVDRLLALMTAAGTLPADHISHIRALGLNADGSVFSLREGR